MKVLITCGATWTRIDEVRVISNISSGQMGHLIAEGFRRKGARVTLIEGPVTHAWTGPRIKVLKYCFFEELAVLLNKELANKYDIVVHAAAVSDFKVKEPLNGKLSSGKALKLNLTATPKLIDKIKAQSPESFLVGFKLETALNPQTIFKTVKSLFTRSGCDLAVANSLKGGYKGFIMDADGKILERAASKQSLAKALVNILT
ncbi:MAG: phosphopantothenoylcysteine decarboxylase [Candidatus Omnitrophica bacterium]|nr:phosphopantothenoylcysteine decarboxylase [Candidatus Omnitrophota bacterium]MDE2223269.1 phosphopantothenoylcysteine decarboxylase [Candidatus Omnitrophota bacterium]